MQTLKTRLPWTPLSRLLAQVTKPFTIFLLIILTLISVATIRPVLSQAVDNSKASEAEEAIKLPLIIFRERLSMVNDNEQISFQPVGIGESFAVPSGSPIIVGNPSTGGYGITLTEAKTVIYYSNSFDLEKRLWCVLPPLCTTGKMKLENSRQTLVFMYTMVLGVLAMHLHPTKQMLLLLLTGHCVAISNNLLK